MKIERQSDQFPRRTAAHRASLEKDAGRHGAEVDPHGGRLAGISDGHWSGADENGDCRACKGTGKGKDGEACWPCHGEGHNDTWADESNKTRERPNNGWDGVHRPGVSPWGEWGIADPRRKYRRGGRLAAGADTPKREAVRRVMDHEFKPYADDPYTCVEERPRSGNTCNRAVEDHAHVPQDVLDFLKEEEERAAFLERRSSAARTASSDASDAQAWASRPGNRDWSADRTTDELIDAWAARDPSDNYGEHNEDAWYEMMYRAENGDPELQEWLEEQLANLADEDGLPMEQREYPPYSG